MTKISPSINESEVLEKMRATGLLIDSIIWDGKIQRVPVEGNPQGKDGGYIAHADPPVSVWWQNWCTGEKSTWSVGAGEKLNQAARKTLKKRIEEDERIRKTEKERVHNEAVKKATYLFGEKAKDCTGHPYLTKKGVGPVPGLKKVDGCPSLLVPIYNKEGNLRTLQYIEPDGRKRLLSGGEKRGNFFPIGDIKNEEVPLLICEGLATGVSLHECTGYPILVAIDAGNLMPVAIDAQKLYQTRQIILCADNDIKEGTSSNVGVEKATEAAQAINGSLAIPELPRGEKADFNDLHQKQGAEAVKQAVAAANEVESDENSQEEENTLLAPPPAVPLDAFPESVAAMLQEAAKAFAVPIQIPAACLLAFLSSLVGRSRMIRLKESWEESGNIWLALVAPSGLGKTPCMTAFFEAIRDLEYQAKKKYDEEYAVFKSALDVYENQHAQAIKGMSKNEKNVTVLSSLVAPTAPKRKRASVDDATVEALSDVLQDNPKGVLWRKDELSGLIADLDKYSSSKGGTKARLLSSHQCEPWDIIRSSNPERNLYIPHACVGIFGGIQPGMLGKVFDAGASGTDEASGFLQRFIFIRAEAEAPSYWNEQSFSQKSKYLLERIAEHLWSWNMDKDDSGKERASLVQIFPAAKAAYINWHDAIANEEFLTPNSSQLAKLKVQAARICLLLHSLKAALAGTSGTEPVEEATMHEALLLADWIKAHQEQCWRFFQPENKPKVVDPIQRAIMQVVVDQKSVIEKNGWKIANTVLYPLVKEELAMPDITKEKLGKAVSALGLSSCRVNRNDRGWWVSQKKINLFKQTVRTDRTDRDNDISTSYNSSTLTAHCPQADREPSAKK